jgi:uncharacterized protein YcaQ
MKVTADAARSFLVARHFLAPARSLPGGLDGVLDVFRRLGSIQFDPIAVAGRNHDLVLHARVAGYEAAWCDALYERREIFEATNKALSFAEPTPSVAFIAPFDSLLWDPALLASLFDFDYVWEGFFPPAKRRWGWYVLPILFGGRFVGRIEPRIDRDRARVEVLDVWWEDGFAPVRAAGFVDAMRDALRAYLRFAGAGHLDWAPHLAAEKRLFLARP